MIRRILFTAGTVAALIAPGCPCAFARKQKLKVDVDKNVRTVAEADSMVQGSLTICSPCVPCNGGYGTEQVRMTGFDKRADSRSESFFVTNTTDRELVSFRFTVAYYTLDGRQLHWREEEMDCSIPPGETRKFDIKSFDTQKSFYYHKSVAPKRRKATPFKVALGIVCISLR